ncbi:hypothetical protein MTO96_043192 [Rhipicephalus appendiculatus]
MNSSPGPAFEEPQSGLTPCSAVSIREEIKLIVASLKDFASLHAYKTVPLLPEGLAPPPSLSRRTCAVMRRRRPRFAEVFPYGHKCGCLLRSDGNVSTVPGVRVYPTASRSRRICGGVDASSPAAPENEFAMDLTLYRSSRAATPQNWPVRRRTGATCDCRDDFREYRA